MTISNGPQPLEQNYCIFRAENKSSKNESEYFAGVKGKKINQDSGSGSACNLHENRGGKRRLRGDTPRLQRWYGDADLAEHTARWSPPSSKGTVPRP